MFPHMYKVRPGKIQQVREPGMTTDYQRQRGESWRKNSSQWGSQGYEGNNTPSNGGGGSSFLPNPPAIPAPPPDPQDNLSRKSSLPSKEPERKGTSSPVFSLQNSSSRGNQRESSISPPRTRTRTRVREQADENSNPVVMENSYPPPGRRSRVRPAETTVNNTDTEGTNNQSIRTRSRSSLHNNSSQNGQMDRHPSNTEEVSFPSSGRIRSRSRQNEEIFNPAPVVESTYPPPSRTRSRNRQIENTDGSDVEASYVVPLRARSRTRANEETPNGPARLDTSSPILSRTRSRSRPTEEIQDDISSSVNSLPPAGHVRSRSRTDEPPQVMNENSNSPTRKRIRNQESEDTPNITEVENSNPLQREGSNSNIGEMNTDTAGAKVRNAGQVDTTNVPTVTIRIRRRPKVEEAEQINNLEALPTSEGSPVRTRIRLRSQESENDDNKIIEPQSSPVRRRARTHQPENSNQDEIINEQNKMHQNKDTNEQKKNDSETVQEKVECEDDNSMKSIGESNYKEDFNLQAVSEIAEIPEQPSSKEIIKIEKNEQVQEKQKSPTLSRKNSLSKEELKNTKINEEESSQVSSSKDMEEVIQHNQVSNEDELKGEHKSRPSPAQNSERGKKILVLVNENLTASDKPLLSNDANDFGKGLNQFTIEERKRFAESPSPYAEQFFKHKEADENEQSNENESKYLGENLPQTSLLGSQDKEDVNEAVHITVEPSTPVDGVDRSLSGVLPGGRNTPEIERLREKSVSREGSPRLFRNKSVSREGSPRLLREKSVSREGSPKLLEDKSVSREGSPRRGQLNGRDSRERSASVASNSSDRQEHKNLAVNERISDNRETSPMRLSRTGTVSRERSPETKSAFWETEEKDESHYPNGFQEVEKRSSKSRSRSPMNNTLESQLCNSKTSFPDNTEEEEDEEEEDPIAKATRLWLLSKDQNSEILEKVLPEIENDSSKYKKTTPIEKESIWLEEESEDQAKQEKTTPIEKESIWWEEESEDQDKIEKTPIEKESIWWEEEPEDQDKKEKATPIEKESIWWEEESEDQDKKEKAIPVEKESIWWEEEPEDQDKKEKTTPIEKESIWWEEEPEDQYKKEKTTPIEKESIWWEEESEDQDKKEIQQNVTEEWNEDFNEEPKNFKTFASIKLKSRPPKSPTEKEKKKKGRVSSKEDAASVPPPPPPPPPSKSNIPAPPPPPPQAKLSAKDIKVKKAREQMVDQIKKAARQRPDWKSVMKDIEVGIKLRKVSSGEKLDRSKPILPKSRGKGGKFFYDSEKPVVSNMLLGEIQRGVKLRHVKTNDRSKPDFNKLGLRKLRRQMTVEEKKSLDSRTAELLPSSSDEEEDIDQMRDDLASTKTQLAEEIKKNKKMETEHKILKIDLHSLEAEVKKLKRKLKEAGIHDIKPLTNGEAEALAPKLSKSMSKLRMMEEEMDFSELDTIEEDIKLLNDQIEAQKKRAEKSEIKCNEYAQKLQVSQNAADEWEMRSVYFEKKYKALQKDQGIELPDIDCSGTQTDPIDFGTAKSESFSALNAKKSSSRKSFNSFSRMQSFKEEDESDEESSSSSEEDTLSDHQGGDDEDEEDNSDENEDDEMKGNYMEDIEKREEREFIMWKNRLSHTKDKIKNVLKERNNLRDRIKKFYKDMRKEREEYLKLKGELNELSDQMKDSEEPEENVEDESDEEEESDSDQEDESPEWWCEETHQKPKKLKKRKKAVKENEEEDEVIVDTSDLQNPQWSDSEEEESENEEEYEDTSNRVKFLKEKTKKLEETMNAKKKETYLLKSQVEQCEEMLGEEKRRHERLESELHMLLADI